MGRKKKKKKEANKKEKIETMSQAAGAYSARRPYEQLAQNRAMHQQLAALQPANNILGMMYGAPAQSSGAQFGGVVSPEMFAVGQTSQDPNQGPVQWDPNQKGRGGGAREQRQSGDGSGRRRRRVPADTSGKGNPQRGAAAQGVGKAGG